jgi:hypothetical protein
MKRTLQLRPTFGALMAAPDRPSIGGETAETRLGPLAMNAGFHNPGEEIAVEAVEMKKLLPDGIIRR